MLEQRRWLHYLFIAAVLVLAAVLRLRAVEHLPVDYDEDDYLRAAQQYAAAVRSGDWAVFTQINYRSEHPPLTKIVNGFAIAPLPPAPEIPDRPTTTPPATDLPRPQLATARLAEMLLSLLGVLAVGLASPLAALFVAINTWDIKYSSQVMLEALPVLTSAVTVLAYARSGRKLNGWLVLSAVALGLTAASKYVYGIVAVAVMVDWLWDVRRERAALARPTLAPLVAWGVIALALFFFADPYLWPDPVTRLRESVFYHFDYAESAHVKAAGLPPWQPFVYLAGSVPWHRGVFLVAIDLLVSLLALSGVRRLWNTQRVTALWLVLALGFLVLWPTKWPQYILLVTVPVSLAAAEGFYGFVWEPLSRRFKRGISLDGLRTWRIGVNWREARRALPWLLPGTLTLLVVTAFPLVFQTAMAMTDLNTISLRDGVNGGVWREAWLGITAQVAPVQVSIGPNGGIVIRVEVRDRGEVHYVPISESGLGERVVHYAGLGLLAELVAGAEADLVVFETIWTVLSVGLQLALGLGLALMLNRRGVRWRGFWQVVFILPWAIPEFVGCLTWLRIVEPANGWVALALGRPFPWRDDPVLALGVLLVAALWLGFPFMVIAASAGLKTIPDAVYDAAAVDGAGTWERFRFIVLPMLLPLLGPAVIIRAIFAFNQFYLFYVLQPPYPLFTFSALSYVLLSANSRFGGQYAISAVINLFTVLILIALLVWFNRRTHIAEGVTYA